MDRCGMRCAPTAAASAPARPSPPLTAVLCAGYDLGLIGGALLNIRDEFGIGDGAAEAIVGAAKFGAFFGTFVGGAAMLRYGIHGRRVSAWALL